MNKIKRIPQKDIAAWVTIITNAYPGMKIVSDEEKKKVQKRLWHIEKTDPEINMYGLYRGDRLLGGMRLFDFTMTMLSTQIPLGGLGLVAVDLAYKKEHVCKDMVDYFIDHYSKKKTPMLALYAFRPDFYRKMGFGYGTKINEYRIKPAELPGGHSKKDVVYATKQDLPALNACYHRYTVRTHGMIRRTKSYGGMLFRPENKILAVKKSGKIEGFMIFSFKTSSDENWLDVQIDIAELIYENREALLELLAFLHSQSDQANRIRYSTHDEYLHFLPHDPRTDSGKLIPQVGHETNTSGIGIMYRIIDTPGLFRALKKHDFNGQNCKLKITVHDSLYPKHAGSYTIHFVDGKPQVKTGDDFEVEITLDVADYSSMVMGSVPFDKLYEYGLAEISDAKYMETISRIFTPLQKPYCVTQF